MIERGWEKMGDFLKHPAVIIVPVIAYFLGWTYLYNYFDEFQVPLSSLNLPLEHYFTYGFIALVKGIRGEVPVAEGAFDWQASFLVCVVLFIVAMVLRFTWFLRIRVWAIAVVGFMLGITGWVLTYQVAKYETTTRPQPVRLALSAPVTADPSTGAVGVATVNDPLSQLVLAEFNDRNRAGDLRMIFQHEDFVVVAFARGCQSDSCSWTVWRVPTRDIRVIRMLTGDEIGQSAAPAQTNTEGGT